MQPTNPIARLPALWRGKVIARALFLIVVAALLAAVAAAFGIAYDYGYLHASILTAAVRRLAPPSHSPPRHTWAGHPHPVCVSHTKAVIGRYVIASMWLPSGADHENDDEGAALLRRNWSVGPRGGLSGG